MGDAARHCVCGCSVDLFHSMASQQVWDYNVLSLRKEIHVQKKMVLIISIGDCKLQNHTLQDDNWKKSISTFSSHQTCACYSEHYDGYTLATNQRVPIAEIPPPPVPPSHSLSPRGSPQRSTIQILENSEEPPALCAQQEINPRSLHSKSNISQLKLDSGLLEPLKICKSYFPGRQEHGVASSLRVADDEGMFGGFFFSQSLLSNQLGS
ncbi:hypothetical protein VPH35_077935 [Triticum aestivum]|uniref:Uncharacterized protein n=1 Tax=Aegilops tauschii TaxID=37682 RepID=M8CCG9_AEGTA